MENIQWLLENGGSAIQLRVSTLKDTGDIKNDTASAVSELLEIDKVRSILNYFDAFETPDRDKKTLEHLIHYYKDTCIERFFPYVMDLGFRSGIKVFDEKMIPVMDMFKFMYSTNREDYFSIFLLMMHRYFFVSGCLFPEVIESMENRLNNIYKAANERIFDIYQDESNLPKKPEIWTNIGVIKDELNPWSRTAEKPLPMWFDLWTLAYYTDKCTDPEKIKKINEIVSYILDPEFQKLPGGGEGLLYVKAKRRYHANSLCLKMPIYETSPFPEIEILDIMSHFEPARKSKWLNDCLNHLEQFKTEKGTYIFPKESLHKKYIDKAFINEKNMFLKGDKRESMKRELISTMKMVEIYERMI